MEMNRLITLIPSYEPDETLVYLARGLKNEGFYVLIVDDGSGPRFQKVFDDAKEYATVLQYEKNHGKGYALRYGYQYIKDNLSEYVGVITADGDGQHRILDIMEVGKRLLEKNKAILGIRSFDVKVPIKSKIGNSMSKYTQTLATHKYLSDNQCGLRAFLVKDLDFHLAITGDRYEYEMKVISSMQLKEIPYETCHIETIYENNNVKTHFKPFLDTVLIQKSIISSGILGLIFFAIEALIASLVYYLLVPVINHPLFDIEVVMVLSSAIAFALKFVTSLIIYKPLHHRKKLFKEFVYSFLLFFASFLTGLLFTKILGWPLPISYLISGILAITPLYYFIKGVGIFFEAQRG